LIAADELSNNVTLQVRWEKVWSLGFLAKLKSNNVDKYMFITVHQKLPS